MKGLVRSSSAEIDIACGSNRCGDKYREMWKERSGRIFDLEGYRAGESYFNRIDIDY